MLRITWSIKTPLHRLSMGVAHFRLLASSILERVVGYLPLTYSLGIVHSLALICFINYSKVKLKIKLGGRIRKPSSSKKTWNLCPYAVVVVVFFRVIHKQTPEIKHDSLGQDVFYCLVTWFSPDHLDVHQMRDTIHSWCEHIVSKKVKRLISFFCHFSYFFCLLLGQTPLRFPLTSSNFKWSIKNQTQSVSPPDEIPRRDIVSNAWYYSSNKIFILFSKSNC